MLFSQHLVQLFTFSVGVLTWRKIKPRYLVLIIFIVFLTIINENFITPWLDVLKNKKYTKDFAYNFFSIIDMIVWLKIFYRISEEGKERRMLFIALAFTFLYSITDIFFFTGISKFHINSIMVYDMSILLLAGNFLYHSLKKEYYQPINDSLFWISAACIGYHSLLFLNFVTLWLPAEYWNQPQANDVWNVVSLSGNIFYYLLLSIAFISCTNYKFRRVSFQ